MFIIDLTFDRMLLGAEGGCVYIHNKENEEIGIAPDVALSHTTPVRFISYN